MNSFFLFLFLAVIFSLCFILLFNKLGNFFEIPDDLKSSKSDLQKENFDDDHYGGFVL